MQYFTGTTEIHMKEPTAITLGKFDGLHRGHQTLIAKVLKQREQGLIPAVFTFDMSPVAVVTGKSQPALLTNEERREHLEQMGIGCLVEYPFTVDASHMPADVFIEKILVERLKVRSITIGTDFHFGYQRSGDAALLARMAPVYGYHLEVVDKLKDAQSGKVISSTFIREELRNGNMEKVHALLGYSYALKGTVVNGNHLGSRIGFPTANILPPAQKMLPPNGVYASRTWIDGQLYESVTNIGRKPTVGEYPMGAETFVYEWKQPLYGREIAVELCHAIRPEMKFSGVEELKTQVERDKKIAREWLKVHSADGEGVRAKQEQKKNI